MRVFAPLFGALLLILLPTTGAHEQEGSLNHISPVFGPLAAGEHKEFNATFEDGKFHQGWVFLIYGRAIDSDGNAGVLDVELRWNNTTATSWKWSANAWHLNTTTLPATSTYELVVSNPTNRSLSYLFYFDQSCDCLAKPLTLPEGYVIFNYDFHKGERPDFGVPLVDGWALRATLAQRTGPGGVWPQDFRIHHTVEHEDAGWLHLKWKVDQDDTYYILVQAVKGVRFTGSQATGEVIEVTPLLEREKKAPGPDVAALLAGVVLAALLLRRR